MWAVLARFRRSRFLHYLFAGLEYYDKVEFDTANTEKGKNSPTLFFQRHQSNL